ncbi:MAG: hypothetical protein IJQ85_09380 [Selenomonadaceae bacterium]|nr:hypothetical protein [Selenomonadaceae bacterium]
MDYRIVAATMAALIGGGLYFYGSPKPPAEPVEKIEKPAPKEIQGFGIINIEKIQANHPNGAYLDELRATELRLRLELNEAMKIVELPKPTPPETNEEVFDEAAWQKNAQIIISQLAELESRRKLAREQYRKDSEPHYIEERNKIRDEFMNDQVNLQLKLQNADNLKLTQEQINELEKNLEAVETARNNAQRALLEKWMAEIEKYAEDSVAEDEKRLKAEYERLREEVEAQARKKESDVTERNKQVMEDSLREMENRQIRRRELLTELNDVGRERAELEKKILNSIADKATMLAAVYRLEMVLVKRSPDNADKILPRRIEWNFELKQPEKVGAVIIPGQKARDLTDDLIKEMNRL